MPVPSEQRHQRALLISVRHALRLLPLPLPPLTFTHRPRSLARYSLPWAMSSGSSATPGITDALATSATNSAGGRRCSHQHTRCRQRWLHLPPSTFLVVPDSTAPGSPGPHLPWRRPPGPSPWPAWGWRCSLQAGQTTFNVGRAAIVFGGLRLLAAVNGPAPAAAPPAGQAMQPTAWQLRPLTLPGATAFTRMRYGASSHAASLVSATTPCLLAV